MGKDSVQNNVTRKMVYIYTSLQIVAHFDEISGALNARFQVQVRQNVPGAHLRKWNLFPGALFKILNHPSKYKKSPSLFILHPVTGFVYILIIFCTCAPYLDLAFTLYRLDLVYVHTTVAV